MHSKILSISFLILFCNLSFSQEAEQNSKEEIAELKKQVSELQKQVSDLRQQLDSKKAVQEADTTKEKTEAELELEQELAEELGTTTETSEPQPTPTSTQVSGTRGGMLQNMNPNIGVIGNFLGANVFDRESEQDGFTFDEAEFSFQMVIDPFARTDVFLAVLPGEEEVELEEAYVTLLALPGSLQGLIGLKRPSFGKLNLTHPIETPFADKFPRMIINFFGEEGLAETGVILSSLLPNPWDLFLELQLGVFDGRNDVSFNGDASSDLAFFGHLKSFFDLTENSSIELGFSGLTGKNDPAGDFRSTLIGADLIYRWKPLRLNQYKSFTWQSEFLYSNREEIAGDVNSLGVFSFMQYQLTKRWFVGGRFDYSEFPNTSDFREVGFSGLVTFWPSEFQTLRLQYRHLNRDLAQDDNAIIFQWLFITGAHGAHEF
ncbi:hypothetical protein GWO43_04430 [candidate division KSB1 bacterium]|nr:hypothetical protein [candidate division KSB1 bacterium]NIR71104.1 hypothetical protein [candidate division KSB1 bacterium]NIS23264.1 hypothetical protein [candidate division KSB1 bacterium]NIT70144.1 hypothetical protein [candidate division KSB1 bacterium]NIU23794.1 hypothetical protein [candidate division KSB1 bacterium]